MRLFSPGAKSIESTVDAAKENHLSGRPGRSSHAINEGISYLWERVAPDHLTCLTIEADETTFVVDAISNGAGNAGENMRPGDSRGRPRRTAHI